MSFPRSCGSTTTGTDQLFTTRVLSSFRDVDETVGFSALPMSADAFEQLTSAPRKQGNVVMQRSRTQVLFSYLPDSIFEHESGYLVRSVEIRGRARSQHPWRGTPQGDRPLPVIVG